MNVVFIALINIVEPNYPIHLYNDISLYHTLHAIIIYNKILEKDEKIFSINCN